MRLKSREYKHLYNTTTWRKASKAFRYQNPICAFCGQISEVTDHIEPHKGNLELFYDPDNWQALCKPCHDGLKKQIEIRGYHSAGSVTGLPIDPNHPANRLNPK